jgi:putative lipoprotein
MPLLALFISACGHLDTTPEPRGDRTLTGTIHFRAQTELPADAKATVRLLDVSKADEPAQVLSEQVIDSVTSSPIAFTLDYKAEDLVPPKRVRLDARISVNGKLRFYSASSYSVTTEKAARPIELWIEASGH